MNPICRMVWPIFWAMVSSLSLLVQTDRSMAKQELFESYKKIIVLDPGHGGQDSGAKGPDKTLEKKVVLELARKVAAELEPEFKVVLTRTDDYHVDLYNRTAIANHIKANLFISIHTGAGFTHSTSGTALYYYQNFNRTDNGQVPPATDKNPHQPLLWKNIQIKYVEQSQALARIVAGRIGKGTTGLIRVEGSPLTVLQGAAMPAVLIEIGHITNPTEEKKLRDQRFLLELAGQISSGIEEFMVQNAK